MYYSLRTYTWHEAITLSANHITHHQVGVLSYSVLGRAMADPVEGMVCVVQSPMACLAAFDFSQSKQSLKLFSESPYALLLFSFFWPKKLQDQAAVRLLWCSGRRWCRHVYHGCSAWSDGIGQLGCVGTVMRTTRENAHNLGGIPLQHYIRVRFDAVSSGDARRYIWRRECSLTKLMETVKLTLRDKHTAIGTASGEHGLFFIHVLSTLD